MTSRAVEKNPKESQESVLMRKGSRKEAKHVSSCPGEDPPNDPRNRASQKDTREMFNFVKRNDNTNVILASPMGHTLISLVPTTQCKWMFVCPLHSQECEGLEMPTKSSRDLQLVAGVNRIGFRSDGPLI